ncbi:MAG TPA: fused MFS/spermidine synthase [Bacteroidota bacterium]|nr:fused MFS/spermidine synthase [Bacteroidota bacterium]
MGYILYFIMTINRSPNSTISDKAFSAPEISIPHNRWSRLILPFGLVGLLFLFAIDPGCRVAQGDPPTIQIQEDEHGRRLVIDHRLKAYADTLTWESNLKYTAVAGLPIHFFSIPGRLLLMGLGAGSIAKAYRKERWSVDAAEPDSGVIAVARRSFGLREEDAVVYQVDPRQFLGSHPDRYDLILEDMVSARSIPPHLMTAEFFGLVGAHLREGGVFGISFECAGWNDPVVASIAATLNARFRSVVVFPIAEPPNRFGAILVVASDAPHEELARDVDRNEGLSPEWRFGPEYQRTHAWDNRFAPDVRRATAQFDTRNTLDRMFRTENDSAGAQPGDYTP